ncbi:unnamed protein product, partial [Allacma fusca]
TRDITLESESLCESAYTLYHGGNSADNILCARPIISEYVAFCHFYGSVLTFTDRASTSRTFLGAVLTSSPKYGFQKGGPCSGKRVQPYKICVWEFRLFAFVQSMQWPQGLSRWGRRGQTILCGRQHLSRKT